MIIPECPLPSAPVSARTRSSPFWAKAEWARSIARDPHLNRDIALKILPGLFALEPDRVARFKREAQVLASLNHPISRRFTVSKKRMGFGRSRWSWSRDQHWPSASRRGRFP
jgi:hypothetical protein